MKKEQEDMKRKIQKTFYFSSKENKQKTEGIIKELQDSLFNRSSSFIIEQLIFYGYACLKNDETLKKQMESLLEAYNEPDGIAKLTNNRLIDNDFLESEVERLLGALTINLGYPSSSEIYKKINKMSLAEIKELVPSVANVWDKYYTEGMQISIIGLLYAKLAPTTNEEA